MRVLSRGRTGAVAVVAAALLASCGSAGEGGTAPTAPLDTGARGSPLPSPPDLSLLPVCRRNQLGVSLADSGGVMSQPFVSIAVRNDSAEACKLRGYPEVRAWGTGPRKAVARVPVRERHTSTYARRDPGPHGVALLPRGAAVFHLGTTTALEDGPYRLTRLDLALPGVRGAAVTLRIPVRLPATRRPGAPVPIRVTALEALPDPAS